MSAAAPGEAFPDASQQEHPPGFVQYRCEHCDAKHQSRRCLRPLEPHLICRIGPRFHSRWLELLSLVFASRPDAYTGFSIVDTYVRNPQILFLQMHGNQSKAITELYPALVELANARRAALTIFPVTSCEPQTLKDALELLRTGALDYPGLEGTPEEEKLEPLQRSYRVITHPTSIRRTLFDDEDLGFDFQPKNFTHVLYLVECYGKICSSVIPASYYIPTVDPNLDSQAKSHISRAYFKLRECFQLLESPGLLSPLLSEVKLPPPVVNDHTTVEPLMASPEFQNLLNLRDLRDLRDTKFWACDIGAAPGGWTEWILEMGGRVVAIDPGVVEVEKLVELGYEASSVKYVQQKIQDCGPFFEEFAKEGHQISLAMCDMNVDPKLSAQCIASLVPFMDPQKGFFILTTKYGLPSAKHNDIAFRQTKEYLSSWFTDFTFHWLFSNGRERTFFGRLRSDPETWRTSPPTFQEILMMNQEEQGVRSKKRRKLTR